MTITDRKNLDSGFADARNLTALEWQAVAQRLDIEHSELLTRVARFKAELVAMAEHSDIRADHCRAAGKEIEAIGHDVSGQLLGMVIAMGVRSEIFAALEVRDED